MTLCNLLESKLPARGGHADAEFSWSTGACILGGVHGSRLHVHQFPVTSAFLANAYKEFAPKLPSRHLCSLVTLRLHFILMPNKLSWAPPGGTVRRDRFGGRGGSCLVTVSPRCCTSTFLFLEILVLCKKEKFCLRFICGRCIFLST